MLNSDKSVAYVIARESSRDDSSKILYCTGAVVQLMMQSRLSSSKTAKQKDDITTIIVDEVHNRSVQSDYVLALTLAAMQKSSRLRLVLMSATGDHRLVEERIPYCQRLLMKGAMHCVRRYFRTQPVEQDDQLLTMIAQIVIVKHNERAGKPLIEHTYRTDGSANLSKKFMIFVPGLAQIHQLCEIFRRALDFGWTWGLISLPFHSQSSEECSDAVFTDPSVLAPRHQLGMNPDIYRDEVFEMYKARKQHKTSGDHTCIFSLSDLA